MNQTIETKREIIKIGATAPMENYKLRVAGYARVSTDTKNQLNSFSVQINYYTNMIEQNKEWELVEVYADEGTSGTTTNHRDDFNRMIADARKGKIDRILTKSTSRFARNTLDAIRIVRELKENGVTVYFEKENIDTEKLTGENLLTLYSLFAQQESISLSQNIKKGFRMRLAKGDYIPFNMPYGYRMVDQIPQIDEPEAEIVRRIFAEYLTGRGGYVIAQSLNAENIPYTQKFKRPWTTEAITDLIKNVKYKGDTLYQQHYNSDDITFKLIRNTGQLPKYYMKNTHQPIVSAEIFDKANKILSVRSSKVITTYSEHILTRKIKCEVCGKHYCREVEHGKIRWNCKNKRRDKKNCESTITHIPQEKIYDAFLRMYNTLRGNYQSILIPMKKQLKKLQLAKNANNIEISAINKEIAKISEQNHVMTGLMSKGILDSALFIGKADELSAKVRKLKQTKAMLIAESEEKDTILLTEELIEFLEESPEYLTEINRDTLDAVVESIYVVSTTHINFKLINGIILTERL